LSGPVSKGKLLASNATGREDYIIADLLSIPVDYFCFESLLKTAMFFIPEP
jgi:hypothetical protein